MKKTIIWIITAILLIGLFVGAGALYNKLSSEYDNDNLTLEAPKEDEEGGETEEDPKDPAPDFTAINSEGKTVRLSDFKGKPIVMNFWATWCGYCTHEMPDFERARETYPDVLFLMVNATDGVSETVEVAKKYMEDNGYGFELLFDTESNAQAAYHVSGFPMTFFIDADGNFIAYANGAINYETLVKGIGMITEQ